jgi:polar amino acid transport system substrate-binding protein
MKGGCMKDNKRWITCAFIVMFVFLGSAAFAGKAMVVAVNASWPPMQMKDDKGNITGYEIDMIKAMAAEAGFQVKIVNVPWGKIFKELDAGKYDAVMASVSITESRKEKFDFSEPYFTAEQLLVVPKSQAAAPLTGKAIAVFKLTTGADAIRKSQGCRMTYYTVEETEQAFKDLAKGDLHGVFCDSPVALNYVFSKSKYKDKFTIVSALGALAKPSGKEEYGIAVRKGNAEALDLVNKGLQAVKTKGIDSQLKDKWFNKAALPATMVGYIYE